MGDYCDLIVFYQINKFNLHTTVYSLNVNYINECILKSKFKKVHCNQNILWFLLIYLNYLRIFDINLQWKAIKVYVQYILLVFFPIFLISWYQSINKWSMQSTKYVITTCSTLLNNAFELLVIENEIKDRETWMCLHVYIDLNGIDYKHE